MFHSKTCFDNVILNILLCRLLRGLNTHVRKGKDAIAMEVGFIVICIGFSELAFFSFFLMREHQKNCILH